MVDSSAFMNVLFVCTGNVCRSPMAEAFLRHEAARRGLCVDVRSTGTHAFVGRAATIDGRRIMDHLGVPMDTHRTRELETELLDWADLVIALSAEHERDTVRSFPEVRDKTFTLKSFLKILPRLETYEDAASWVASAARAREGVPAPSDNDVEDPYGAREEAYRRVATEIRDLIDEMASGLEEKQVTSGS